jgi:hypothetical protein
MFGAATTNQQSSSLFGGGNAGSNNTPASSSGGGLFGNTSGGTPGFGQQQPQQQQQQSSLFGGGSGGGGLFGNAGNANSPFGSSSNQNQGGGGGLFGSSAANAAGAPSPSATGGLFGNNATNSGTQQQQQGGGLFGSGNPTSTTSTPSLFGTSGGGGGGGLFGGGATTTTTTTTQGGLFGKPPTGATTTTTTSGGGLFGGGGAAAGGSGLFGKPAGTTTTSGGGLFGGGGGGGSFGNASAGNQQNQSSGGGLFGGGLGQQQQTNGTTSSLFGNRPSLLGGTQPQNQQGLSQFQQQQNSFFNVPESITTQAQGGPTLFGGNLAPSEALLRARQQRQLASQPPANGTTLEPVKELHDVMNAYNPQHPEYRFKAFFYNIAQDPRQKVKIQNIDERTWHELLDKVGGEENENGLWPCRVDGFDGLFQREQAQEEELKSQEAFVNAYNQCIRQINSWKEGSYEVRRTQCERRREEHAHRVLKVMRKLESFRAAYHRRVNPQLSTSSMRRVSGVNAYNRGAINGGSTFASKEERELFEVLQNLKRALDGSGKESLSRQAQQLTTTARVKTQELSRQLATSPLRGGAGSLLAGTTTTNGSGYYEINNNDRTSTSPPSSSGQQHQPSNANKKKSNKPVLLQPYDRERTKVTKTDLDDLSSHKDVVDLLAGNIKSMREDLTRMCLAYGLQPVISANADPQQQQQQYQHLQQSTQPQLQTQQQQQSSSGGFSFGQQQQQQQQQQNPALAAHQFGTTPARSSFF